TLRGGVLSGHYEFGRERRDVLVLRGAEVPAEVDRVPADLDRIALAADVGPLLQHHRTMPGSFQFAGHGQAGGPAADHAYGPPGGHPGHGPRECRRLGWQRAATACVPGQFVHEHTEMVDRR